jgi:Ca-activated chloride channel family protein
MRRAPLLAALAIAAVFGQACAGAATNAPGGNGGGPVPPIEDHHQPTYPPIQPREPQSTPYDGVTFEDPGVNPPVDPGEDRASTFALDVDTASYTVVRRFVRDGNRPDPASIRVEEFVNYFDQGYPAPEEGTFGITVDGSPTPFLNKGEVLMRVGIKARDVGRRERPPAALTFVVDVSGSMAREDRLELVKQALRLLVDGLRARDTVAIVVFGSEARVVLRPTTARDRELIFAAIDRLQPEGSTNAEAGLRLGYQLARDNLLEGGINRVVLASDGVANVGLTDPDEILGSVKSDAAAGIQLVSVGVGMGNYNDALMERLADQGDGFYAYVDAIDEARRLFVEDLTSTIDSVALDAKVQVEFDPAMVESYRLIGFENRAVADEDFRNGRVNAGAIGAGHEVTALYALRLARDGDEPGVGDGRIATVNLRWTDPDTNRASEIAHDVEIGDLAGRFLDSDPHFKLDALVAATAETLRGSPWIEGYRLRDVAEIGHQLSSVLPQTDQVHDFLDLVDEAARLDR